MREEGAEAGPPFRWRLPVVSGWAGLLLFWAVLLALLGGGAGLLAWLGPPEAPVAATAPALGPAVVEAAPAQVAASLTAPEPAAAPALPLAASSAKPAAPPAAPAPPPLLDAALRVPAPAQSGRPIPAADPALLEPGPHGPLPRIGPEGRTAIRTYGRPFDRQDPRPRLGLIVGGLGMNAALTEEAVRRLPGGVTLGFSPYSPHVALLLDQARAKGMEILVGLPLEPPGHPNLNNAGDRALLTGLPAAENADRLDWVLSRFTGYVGAIGALGPMRGERFAALPESIGAVQEALYRRGLLYVDPRPAEGRAAAVRGAERAWGRAVDIVVDEPATRSEIERKLAALERLARERGTAGALGYAGEASPVLVDRIAAWAGGVEGRGLVLAPVSAMIRRPEAAVGTTAGAGTEAAAQPARSTRTP
ncbi:divergent polysaccharide deacetylase family protein [Siccirubricoccus sp. G192]|uniref:divergent polysaccharide deacetylase family protein n=1 Tax=Siccirubricoccus sp. G192 TaxID=2849651 RepID=UPI001C2C0C21|nr:divergent polysaccharide deacetylase family protein [Siccirubricoccus sp. G192]MBV1797026.1 divergent polysaccharide deacetylase family protein [Siccirubricoccus sp. G192]